MSQDNSITSIDDLKAKHKKEQKDLIATITSLKKQATKKTRKNVNTKCADLQSDLELRHSKELSEIESDSTPSSAEPANTGEEDKNDNELTPEQLLAHLSVSDTDPAPTSTPEQPQTQAQPQQQGGKKRNRQKERLAKRKAEIEAVQAQAREESAQSTDYRKIEQESMDQILALQNLKVHDIRPDGHCLFASIEDQLKQRHAEHDHELETDIQGLRKLAAEYMKVHKDDFIPFFFDVETMEQKDFEGYLQELQDTAMWGSDLEIKALASVFDCPIKVYTAGAAPISFNSDGSLPELKLGFYRYSYGLGEHYNSLRDV